MKILKGRKDPLPSFFVNSIPKSGTHLVKQIVLGMPHIEHHHKNEFYEGRKQNIERDFYRLGLLKENEFAVGHVFYSQEWEYMLKRLEMKHIFITRDPRDVVVSFAHFIGDKLVTHPLHEYFTDPSTTQKDKLLAIINGKKTKMLEYPNIREWFGYFNGWLNSDVHQITFEELMISEEQRNKTVTKLAEYLWEGLQPPIPISKMVKTMEANIKPSKSITFRKGTIGSWQDEFDEETKHAFKAIAGDLLIKLNYEKDNNW